MKPGQDRRPPSPSPSRLLRDPICLLAFGFGTGLSPRAPGTVGSVLGLALYVMLADRMSLFAGLAVSAVLFLIGIWLCGVCARRLGVHDHPGIVWDEIVGCFLTCVLAPGGGWGWWLAAFVAFRVFDIIKPWPIRELDHGMGGGTGIMLDDIAAAVMAAAVLHAGRVLLTTGLS
jgi:phosphatidylglycerophosphatase A